MIVVVEVSLLVVLRRQMVGQIIRRISSKKLPGQTRDTQSGVDVVGGVGVLGAWWCCWWCRR